MASLAMLGLIGALDHGTGTELRIYPLYVVPVALSAWKMGLGAGMVVSALAVGAWVGSNLLAGLTLPAWIWVFNTTAHATAFCVVVALVVYLQRSRAAERALARTDALTGLLNARAFYEVAAAELDRQRRYPHDVTLAFVDLDNFKSVNDRFGHQAGDMALVTVAGTLRRATRATDILARLGGDEFALLLPETDLEGARQILQRLHAFVGEAMAAQSWPVTCSVGAVTFHVPPGSVDEIVGAADSLMYRVKDSGKSAVCIERLGVRDLPAQGSGEG
jgi:diguanylate cyclase (GGDEF)-like protein